MKTNKIILGIISIILSSCFSENYRIITHVDRDGSCRREIRTTAGSIPGLFPYDLDTGWEISQTDTVVKGHLSEKVKKNIRAGRKFDSVDELSSGLRRDIRFPTPEESLKKRFRWFYTYYAFTALYPEVSEKGHVPMDRYLNRDEQKLYLRGDMSAYRGMSGMELKEALDDIEKQFMKWYSRSLYEESFEVVRHYMNVDPPLSSVKDTLFSIHEEQLGEMPGISDVCRMLDRHFATDRFSKLYAGNGSEMDQMLEERVKATDELLKFDIRYELTLPGKIITANTDLQNDGVLAWKVNLFRFLADDYTLAAESRAVNVWAFAVTLLLAVFAGYCFKRYF
ncbi:MAG: hypothetical protein LBL04_04955 [Bacteroidales bacterium]|jgi:hypothetical protein|nr:hypothetical protein [Bacteroidales bacterium]